MKLKSKFSNDETPEFPELKAMLSDPLSQQSIEIRAKIDTGFSGSLLIGLEDYTRVGLQFHEEPENTAVGRLTSGASVSLKVSQGILKLGDTERIPCTVYTTPLLMRPLIGRQLLNLWKISLDGQKGLMEIET